MSNTKEIFDTDQDVVVILHGIGMPKMRMAWVEFCLKRAGFKTLNIGYPSLRNDIESCASFVAAKLPTVNGKIHFVSHSMGCLVALHLLSAHSVKNAGRAVFIAPPYRGSEVADFLQKMPLYGFMFGPAGAQLTTQYRSNVHYALPQDLEIGVIAGTRAYEYPLFLSVMKPTGSHDGLVSVSSTHIPGVKDHITIRMSHSFLLEKSAPEMVHFLEHGRFSENAARVSQKI